jgi:hypothetical protein
MGSLIMGGRTPPSLLASATSPAFSQPPLPGAPLPAAAVASLIPTGQLASSVAPPLTPLPSLLLLKDARNPTPLSQAALQAIDKLRVRIAADDAAAAGNADSDAAKEASFLRRELSAVAAGLLDASQVVMPPGGGDAAQACILQNKQCGGLAPGSNTQLWQGASDCCNGTTCVQTNPDWAQCLPIGDSRAHGCSALNARCGGNYWDGPSCCATGYGCQYINADYSNCQLCNALWAQCGGTVPSTGKAWAKATCCTEGSCKQYSSTFSKCSK